MAAEFIPLTKQQVVSLLVEIAELRCQITDLTVSRDKFERESSDYQKELSDSYEVRSRLRAEGKASADKLDVIRIICSDFDLNDVCNDCSPRDADHCVGCDAPLEELKEKILNVITEANE